VQVAKPKLIPNLRDIVSAYFFIIIEL
jgi:hypothetical protein